MEKMTPQEYKKWVFKTKPLIVKICYNLYITDIEITDSKVWNNNNDYNYRLRELNPYNPLSYLVLVILLPISIIINGLENIDISDIPKLFKYR